MKLYSTLFLFLIIQLSLSAQIVSTITAGNCTDGLAQDHNGNVYCSDWGGNIVYRIDSAGNSVIFKGGFANPNGIAIDDTNHVYVCDHTDNKVEKYDQAGTLVRNYSGFSSPAGIKRIPNSNNFIVVEYNTSRIKILQPNGIITLKHSGLPLNGPAGIASIDSNLYIANFNDRKIYSYINDTLQFIAQLPSHSGSLNYLGFLTALNGKLYATHISGNRIYEIDPTTGIMNVLAGNGASGAQDGVASLATFNQPNGILADTTTNQLYVSEAGSKNLRVISNLTVSINEHKNTLSGLKLFPNPISSQLNVLLPNHKPSLVQFSIYNSLGQEMYTESKKVINQRVNIQLNDTLFPPGSYVLGIKTGNKITSRLFIKK